MEEEAEAAREEEEAAKAEGQLAPEKSTIALLRESGRARLHRCEETLLPIKDARSYIGMFSSMGSSARRAVTILSCHHLLSCGSDSAHKMQVSASIDKPHSAQKSTTYFCHRLAGMRGIQRSIANECTVPYIELLTVMKKPCWDPLLFTFTMVNTMACYVTSTH